MITFPRPFSLNNMFANIPGRGRVKSSRYNVWIKHADALALTQKLPRFEGPVALHIRLGETAVRPNFDGDNALKPILDRLVAWGVIEDDNRTIVKRLWYEWEEGLDGCRVDVFPE
jgi:Holliday junction resolvase RusA-like endonuclease